MENKNNILIEIEKLAPNFSEIKKENDFGTPDQYFDELSSKIQNRIINQNSQKKTLVFLQLIHKPQYAVAAFLVVIFIGVYFFRNKTTQTAQNNTVYWDEILNDNTIIDKVDESLLVEAYIEESHNQILKEKKNIKDQNNISEEDLSDYVEKEYSNDIFNEL